MPKIGMRDLRRAQLIDATLQTIDQSGLSGTTLATVAQRANISTGIVSHYFGGKDGLLEATMRHVLRDLWEATMRRRLAAKPEPRARLRAIVAANFDVSQVNTPVMKTWLAFWAESMHQPTLRRLQRVNTRRLYSNLCAEFEKALPRAASRRAATGLAAMIDGLWLRGATTGEPFDTKAALRLANDYIDLLLDARAKARTRKSA
ncbi:MULTISPECIES: transcriptional regulator BetI [Paraburkholderia]|jgi:TetR/AcrR family transcriptional regulator, transcriptional repressor of bet genes|uniref:HTH-type transcriptional regulator BetI n=1 Tax=Paraburkholderia tropica TaxID=92647 RepID=A0A1A5XF67_9BURK|nr:MULTISPECIES: transcriptional regulator BetI [Paraburkholderia]MBB2978842.1 TetR/AcrR family transcriptional repressor of bet genes [Paraburkholderia tropica]MBB2999327.1 TetR/AcrR family transcriptional repressor of bet genes [Paraburkholderia tropica]MBB6318773.1 TetR/AcrR family transcriptional repressor of bet genes [Paraburkholderia tropica]MBN3808023.1 transcriptional regulator BetI [Paraburkholderia sp. Ac-20347]MDE1139051.1 transcriptional regulator BetI [Paraburkholderia tropica]